MKRNSTKDLGLEGLRGIASLIVAVGHYTFVFFPYLGTIFTPVPGAAPAFHFERWIQYPPFSLLYSAEAAVCVFFVMSGYVLTTKYFATGDIVVIQAAASKRYIRLVLPSAASVMFAWVLAVSGAIITRDAPSLGVAGWVSSWYVGPFSFLGSTFNAFVGAPLFSHTQLNPPLWTIQVELIGSILLFMTFGAFGRRFFWLCAWFIFFADLLGYMLPNVLFYVSFLAGAFLNPARKWLRGHPFVSLGLFLLGLIGCAYNLNAAFATIQLIRLPDLLPYGPNFNVNARLFWNSIGAVAMVAGVLGSPPIGTIFASRVPVFLGKISFSVYIVHMPLLMSVGLWAAKLSQTFGLTYLQAAAIAFVLYLSAVLVVGTLFEKFVDAPSIKLANMIGSLTRPRLSSGGSVRGNNGRPTLGDDLIT